MPKTKILIVEDEVMVLNLCAAVLDRLGFETILARNGVEGLEKYRGDHKEICLVLSDVSLPDMGGIKMVRTIFEIDPHSNVIMMSGHNLSVIIPREVGKLCSLIQKPFTAGRLIEAVKKCLDPKGAQSEPDLSREVA